MKMAFNGIAKNTCDFRTIPEVTPPKDVAEVDGSYAGIS